MADELFRERYIGRIRRYLKDFKEKNKLMEDIDGTQIEESSDEMINDAIDAVYDDALIAPPVKLVLSLNEITKHLWFLYGVCGYLLDSAALESIRNTMPLQDGGISIDDNFKSGPFTNAAQNLWAKYAEGLTRLKLKTNIEAFEWIGTSGRSAYRYWGGYWM